MADRLPAKLSSPDLPMVLPNMEAIEPTHFDGWDATDLKEWLGNVIPTFATIRRGIGLALWHLRQRVPDGEYGQVAEGLAKVAGVTPATVGRWRTDAENYYSLAPPSPRTEARRSRASARELDQPPLELPPPNGSEPAPAIKVNNGCGHLLARRAEDGRCLDCSAQLDPPVGRIGVTPQPLPATRPPAQGSKAAPDNPCVRCRGTGVEPDRRANTVSAGVVDPAYCSHPLARRLGTRCTACSTVVGAIGMIGGR